MKSTPLHGTANQEILSLNHYTHCLPIKLLLKDVSRLVIMEMPIWIVIEIEKKERDKKKDKE